MRLNTLAYLIGEAGRNIRRNGMMSVAALSTVAITMAVFGGATFSLYRLKQFADTLPRQFEIAVFLNVDRSRADALDLQRRILAMRGVRSATLFTREQAWADLQHDDAVRQTTLAVDVGVNPLPDRLDVRVSEPTATVRIAGALRDARLFPEVHRVRDDRETLEQVLAAARLVRNVGGVVAILLFIASAVVIQNTIRLTVFARRREIRIMQLVGATAAFIRLPLMIEGVAYGSLGALLAGAVVLFVTAQIAQYTHRFQTALAASVPPSLSPAAMLAVLVATGAAVGLLGSVLSIRRFLKRV